MCLRRVSVTPTHRNIKLVRLADRRRARASWCRRSSLQPERAPGDRGPCPRHSPAVRRRHCETPAGVESPGTPTFSSPLRSRVCISRAGAAGHYRQRQPPAPPSVSSRHPYYRFSCRGDGPHQSAPPPRVAREFILFFKFRDIQPDVGQNKLINPLSRCELAGCFDFQ